MKKVLKNNFKTIIIAVIASVVTCITSIFAYSLIAENVGFTPHDTTWNVENVEAALNNLNLRENQLDTYYSTEEQVVGEWTDGKPLYQKVIQTASVRNWNTLTTIENAEHVHIVWFFYYVNDSVNEWLPVPYDGNSSRIVYGIKSNAIKMDASTSWTIGSGHPVIFAAQYTKTTD